MHIVLIIVLTISEFYGLWLSGQDSFNSFIVALLLPPVAVFKGFFGIINHLFILLG